MRRVLAACSVLGLVAYACAAGPDRDEEALRRYARAWRAGGATLAKTITGPDVRRLVDALRAFQGNGVERTGVGPIAHRDGALDARVQIRFADGAQIGWRIRATIERDRVVAEPSAIASELTRWHGLAIRRYGSPRRGSLFSRDRTPLEGDAMSLAKVVLDERLAGSRGVRVSADERILAEAGVRHGSDVVTSLDDEIQKAAEDTLGKIAGALVAVDPRTGGIRALVSNPSTDEPDRSPATSAYSPGSTFKIVTAAAALESKVLGPVDRVPCPARVVQGEAQITNFGARDHGTITFEEAFAVSCNTAFSHIGVAVGTARLLRTARRLGFRVGELDRPGRISVPTSRGELAVWSFGADGSRVSPLQMAGIGATVAGGGIRVTPGWTEAGNTGRRALREGTAADLVKMMEEVVETGTGRNARAVGVQVAGKTGTADPEKTGGRSDAWFVGLAPSRDTELVAVALLPGTGIGGRVPATLVSRFFTHAFDLS